MLGGDLCLGLLAQRVLLWSGAMTCPWFDCECNNTAAGPLFCSSYNSENLMQTVFDMIKRKDKIFP